MALATKCPHCNTIFRVAHDQLKLRGGIVRCGSCNQVFDGNAALLEPPVSAGIASAIDTPAVSPGALTPPEIARASAESDELDLNFDNLDDNYLPPLPVTAAADFPDSVAPMHLEFDAAPEGAVAGRPPAPLPEPAPLPVPEMLPEFDPLPAPLMQPESLPAPESAAPPEAAPRPTAQDLLGDDALSEAELQAAIDAELAALAARMAAAQPAAAVQAAPGRKPAPGDERREPTLDFPLHPDELDEEDEQALLQLSVDGPAAGDDIPPSHTLLRTASAPPADRYYEPEFRSTGVLVAEPVLGQYPLEPEVEAELETRVVAEVEAAAEAADDEPGFVKRERHRARYGRATTIALCLGIVLMLGALAAQGLTTFRNPLAAAMPSLKPALVAACKPLACKVELPSQIDELAIEQGELQTLSDNTFSFSTAVKNNSGSAQAWPHMELVLDDANDKTVLRRVFAPHEYLPPEVEIDQGFPARSEQAVKLYFELKQLRASGYHIAVFYP